MPKQYESIRDEYVRKGKSLKEAKKLAAMTYNKIRDKKPSLPPLNPKHKSS